MARWQKGKAFRKGKRVVRYIYKNGQKAHRVLVNVERMAKTGKRYYGYARRASGRPYHGKRQDGGRWYRRRDGGYSWRRR